MNSRNEMSARVVEQMNGRRAVLIGIVDSIGGGEKQIPDGIERWLQVNPRSGRLGQRHVCRLPANAIAWDVYVRGVVDWLVHEQMVRASFRRAEAILALTPQHFWELVVEALEQGVSGDVIVIISGMHEPLADMHGLHELYDAFARLRGFTSEWRRWELGVHHVVVGLWSNVALHSEFERAHTSWPFDAGLTLLQAPSLTIEEVRSLMNCGDCDEDERNLYARYLWELTNGDDWAVRETLQIVAEKSQVDCDVLAESAQEFAVGGVCQRELLRRYERTSPEARAMLHSVLEGGLIVVEHAMRREHEELDLNGWIRFDGQGGKRIGRLRSWVVEYALRRSMGVLRSRLPASVFFDADELLPPVRCLNQDAYECVCEIENLLRNLVVIRLHVADVAAGRARVHPLQGQRTSTLMAGAVKHADEYARADATRRHFLEDKDLRLTHAPAIAFSTTQPVLELVEQLAISEKDPVVSRLGKLIARDDFSRFKALRDAVAHNQMVSESARTFLRDLRVRLVNALAA